MIIVRGGGDLATGTIYKLHACGYHVLILETDRPTAIRRSVSFSEAVYDGTCQVEHVLCRLVHTTQQCIKAWEAHEIPLIVDPDGSMIKKMRPKAVIDAILAKKNLGTSKDMAPLTIALGPGFCAGSRNHPGTDRDRQRCEKRADAGCHRRKRHSGNGCSGRCAAGNDTGWFCSGKRTEYRRH